jgi:CheY-like chemotaxis protein
MTDKQKILIVDDKRENLVALRQVLSDLDVEIIEATSGNEALTATLDHHFAVAILDVMMPGMNGYELAEHLRGDKLTRVIPIVFVTASYVDEHYQFRGYEAGGRLCQTDLRSRTSHITLGVQRIEKHQQIQIHAG